MYARQALESVDRGAWRWSSEYTTYWMRYIELLTGSGCLMWGNRVIVPQKFQNKLVAHHMDEISGTKLFLVAGIRQGNRRTSTKL